MLPQFSGLSALKKWLGGHDSYSSGFEYQNEIKGHVLMAF